MRCNVFEWCKQLSIPTINNWCVKYRSFSNSKVVFVRNCEILHVPRILCIQGLVKDEFSCRVSKLVDESTGSRVSEREKQTSFDGEIFHFYSSYA